MNNTKEDNDKKGEKFAIFKTALKEATGSRFFVGLSVLLLVEMLVMAVMAIIYTRAGLTIKTHCEVVGRAAIDCTSGDAPWYYILNFAILPLIAYIANIAIAIKLLILKGRQLALAWLWMALFVGLVMTVIGSIMIMHVV